MAPTVNNRPTEHLPTEAVLQLAGHEGAVLAVRFNASGTYCLSCGKVLARWAFASRVSLSCSGALSDTLCQTQDRTLRLWNPHKGTAIKTYTGTQHIHSGL